MKLKERLKRKYYILITFLISLFLFIIIFSLYSKKLNPKLNDYIDFLVKDEIYKKVIKSNNFITNEEVESFKNCLNKDELEKISTICREFELPLFLDGARLGYGVMAKETDVDIKTIAKYCDIFYIGGTKIGALCGEAVVFTKNNMPKHFTTRVKQHGALLAKGRLLGVQFDALFTDNLYFDIAKNAIDMAELLKKGLADKGYKFYLDSPTNQQFIILENSKMNELSKYVRFSFWEKYNDSHTVVRFATSWATKREDVESLIALL